MSARTPAESEAIAEMAEIIRGQSNSFNAAAAILREIKRRPSLRALLLAQVEAPPAPGAPQPIQVRRAPLPPPPALKKPSPPPVAPALPPSPPRAPATIAPEEPRQPSEPGAPRYSSDVRPVQPAEYRGPGRPSSKGPLKGMSDAEVRRMIDAAMNGGVEITRCASGYAWGAEPQKAGMGLHSHSGSGRAL